MLMRWNRSPVVDGRPSVLRLVTLAMFVLAAGRLHGQYSFEEVASGLKHPDPATRLRAIQILKDANYIEAAAPIAVVLEDPDDRVQLAAIDAERALFTSRPLSRRKKIGFIVEVRSADPGGLALGDSQIALLPRRVPPAVLSGLTAAMRDQNPRVRLEAMYLFGLLAPRGGPAAASELRGGLMWTIEALRRGDRPAQLAAAAVAGRALQHCGAAESPGNSSLGGLCDELGNVLIETINSRDPQLRRAAMRALGQLRYWNATQALTDQLSYYQRGADAEAALEGLAGIGHETSASIFRRELSNSSAEMRRLAIEGLASAGQREDAAELAQLGQAERSNRVLLALHYARIKMGAASKLEASARPDQLVAALGDGALRSLAVQYLLDLSPSIAPALAESLGDQDPDRRRLVADILGFSGDATIIPALEAAAKDPDEDVALAARRAIDRIKIR
jgi:HEAT repeat protein